MLDPEIADRLKDNPDYQAAKKYLEEVIEVYLATTPRTGTDTAVGREFKQRIAAAGVVRTFFDEMEGNEVPEQPPLKSFITRF